MSSYVLASKDLPTSAMEEWGLQGSLLTSPRWNLREISHWRIPFRRQKPLKREYMTWTYCGQVWNSTGRRWRRRKFKNLLTRLCTNRSRKIWNNLTRGLPICWNRPSIWQKSLPTLNQSRQNNGVIFWRIWLSRWKAKKGTELSMRKESRRCPTRKKFKNDFSWPIFIIINFESKSCADYSSIAANPSSAVMMKILPRPE